MSLKGKIKVPGFTQNIELKNCSNNVLCDSASDRQGKNTKRLAYESQKDAGRIFMAYKFRFSSWLEFWGRKSYFFAHTELV